MFGLDGVTGHAPSAQPPPSQQQQHSSSSHRAASPRDTTRAGGAHGHQRPNTAYGGSAYHGAYGGQGGGGQQHGHLYAHAVGPRPPATSRTRPQTSTQQRRVTTASSARGAAGGGGGQQGVVANGGGSGRGAFVEGSEQQQAQQSQQTPRGPSVSTMSNPTEVAPKELMARAMKVADHIKDMKVAMQSPYMAHCRKHGLTFLMEVAATDASQSQFVVRLQLYKGDAALFREMAARILPNVKLGQ